MSDIHTRRKRRFAILVTIILLIAGGVVALIYARQWQRAQQDQHQRAVGIEAYENGEYMDAIRALGGYIQRVPDDTEALHLFAQANLKLPSPTGGQVGQAMNALIRVTQLDPKNIEAAEQLLEIYKLSNQDDEALRLSERVLADDPGNVTALTSRAIALARLNRPAEALQATSGALEQDPDNVALHLLLIQLRYQLGDVPDDLLRYAAELREKNPEDPRYEMMLGYAYALSGDDSQALRWLRSAADRPIDDPHFAFMLVSVLDTAKLYEESLTVLTRIASSANEGGLLTEMTRRLFEAQRYDELTERLNELQPDLGEPRPEDLALRAMALYHMDRRDDAAAVVAELQSRQGQPTAPVWATVLEQVYAQPRRPVPQTVEVLNQALQTMPGNAYLHAFLGDAYASMGDTERALASWRRAAEERPSWGGVRVLLAKTLLNTGQPDEALAFAEEAMLRQPGSVDAAVTLIRARAATLTESDRAGAERLLTMIDEVQQAAPGEPQTLLLRVATLAQTGQKDAAAAAVRELIDRPEPLPQPLLLQLAEVSARHELGLESEIYARAEQAAGKTADLAMARARRLAREGRVDEGLALLETGLQNADEATAGEWRLAIATYLDAAGEPGAAEAWISLADDYPDNVRLQLAALRASSVREDRAFTGRVIDRLQKLMGEKAVTFRIERARWLLESPNPERDAATAAALLREVIADAPRRLEPRIMLVRALERLDRLQVAVRELRATDQAIPGSPIVQLELARLYQELKQFPNAREALDQVADSDHATSEQRRTAAVLLARQGDELRAIEVLEGLAASPGGIDEEGRLLLASLYSRTGKLQQAERVAQDLLANEPSAAALAFSLQLYHALGQQANVDRVLQQLDASSLPEESKRQVRAAFLARTGDRDQAAEVLRAAAEASPEDAEAWNRLVAFQLAGGDADGALATAEAAAARLPDNASLRDLRNHADLVRASIGDESLRSLVLMLVNANERDRKLAVEALRAADAEAQTPEALAARASKLRTLANQNQGVLALQVAAARALLEADQPQAAEEIASRAARAFPTAAEPAWLLTESLRVQGRWLDVLGAAGEWRNRSINNPQAPDLMIVEAKLRLGQVSDTLQRLQPYLRQAMADPIGNADIMSRYLRALVANGRTDQATDLILPLIPQSKAYRLLAMQVAGEQIADGAAASRWLDEVTRAMSPGDATERMMLAQSWWNLSQRVPDPAFTQRARAVVDELTGGEDASATAWHMRGVMAEQAGQSDAAEAAYRQALQRDPNLALTQNNLAMLLINRDGDTAEALALAEAAVAAQPRNTAFLDTLALVQAKAGQYDAAIQTINRAIQLEPAQPAWQETLANILEAAGRTDEAEQLRQRVRSRFGARG